jgi:hypothetical protein
VAQVAHHCAPEILIGVGFGVVLQVTRILHATSFKLGMLHRSQLQDAPSVDPRSAGLLLPSFDVHAHREKPQVHRYVPDEAAAQIVGGQMAYERV